MDDGVLRERPSPGRLGLSAGHRRSNRRNGQPHCHCQGGNPKPLGHELDYPGVRQWLGESPRVTGRPPGDCIDQK